MLLKLKGLLPNYSLLENYLKMTTQDVANRLVALCRVGKNDQAVKELYAPDIVLSLIHI